MERIDKYGDEIMKNKNNNFNKLIALFLCITLILPLAGCSGKNQGNEQDSEYCTMTFDLNYEGSVPETRKIKTGTRTTSYQASRSGYNLEGWYRSAECKDGDTFDFTSYIEKDITLYAKWTEVEESVIVTFDLNYNRGDIVTVDMEKGTSIQETMIPSCERLGMEYSGWYTDANCTAKWDMEASVEYDITLYAKYQFTDEVPRDRKGNVVYNNVTVNFFMGTDLGTSGAMKKLVEAFNAENQGRIKVVYSTKLESQDDYALRYQQIPGMNAYVENYYTSTAVYDLAGTEVNESTWYKEASRDCYVEGKMYSIPIVAGVPFIIYNKELMTAYNGNGNMPSNYASYEKLLSKVYSGESKHNSDFKSILTDTSWSFKEAASYATFIQNGADYYVYEEDAYKNNWGKPGDEVYTAAHNSFSNVYNLFGKDGSLHGGLSKNMNYTISEVWKKNAFMGIINDPSYISSVIADDSMGVLPLSGLFASSGSDQANQIPVHTIGFQFYKAKNVSLVQLAAAAKFVDYVSRNSLQFAESGWYPLRISVAKSDAFIHSSKEIVQFLQQVGEPQNFRTLDGYVNEKRIFNTIGAEGNVVPLLKISNVTSEDLETSVAYLKRKITALLN